LRNKGWRRRTVGFGAQSPRRDPAAVENPRSSGDDGVITQYPRIPRRKDSEMSQRGPEVTVELLQRALEAAGIVYELTDSNGRVVDANKRFEVTTGYTLDEARGHTPAELSRSDEHPREYFDAIWARVRAGHPWNGPMVSRRKDGTMYHQRVAIQPIGGKDGRALQGFVTLKTDITDQARATQRHRAPFDAASDAILVSDFDTALIIEANLAAGELFGYKPAQWLKRTGRSLCSPSESEAVAAITHALNETGLAEKGPLKMVRADGTEFWADLRVSAFRPAGRTRMVSVIRDISRDVARSASVKRTNAELLRVHEQLAHAGKLAAIGRMAEGIAHEVNNPAQYVLLNLTEANEILRGEVGARERAELAGLVADATRGMREIADLTRELLGLSRLELADLDVLELKTVAMSAARRRKDRGATGINVVVEASDEVLVQGDAQRLTEVVAELIDNAVDAVLRRENGENGRRGRVALRTFERHQEAVLSVRDNGVGMDSATALQASEPFFTTKDVSHGKGLGLPLAVETVRKHGGRLHIDSVPGAGTTVELRLPIVDTHSPRRHGSSRPRSRKRSSADDGTARILVIDDSELVLRTFERVLRKQFKVVTADSGDEAVAKMLSGKRYAAVLCDLHMRGFDGIDVYNAIASKRPDLADRFIFCTGAAITDRVFKFLDRNDLTLLAKPIEPVTLLQAISDIAASTAR